MNACRYVERNGLRAGLVERAEEWRWSSLWRRQAGHEGGQSLLLETDKRPARPPGDWLACVNRAESKAELDAMRRCVCRGALFGEPGWQKRAAARMGIERSLRPIGRPRKRPKRLAKGSKEVWGSMNSTPDPFSCPDS